MYLKARYRDLRHWINLSSPSVHKWSSIRTVHLRNTLHRILKGKQICDRKRNIWSGCRHFYWHCTRWKGNRNVQEALVTCVAEQFFAEDFTSKHCYLGILKRDQLHWYPRMRAVDLMSGVGLYPVSMSLLHSPSDSDTLLRWGWRGRKAWTNVFRFHNRLKVFP